MEIVPKNQISVIDAYINQVQVKPKPEEDAEKTSPERRMKADTVIISETAKRIQEAQSELRSVPDVRADKVSEIKRQIEDGTYEIKADAIAENMIRGSLINDWFT